MGIMLKRLICFLLTCLLAVPTLAAVSVSVDRDPVVLDESFQLVFKSDEQINGQPDFSQLEKDFTILNTSQRSSTQIINGKVSYTQQWSLTLLARQSGKQLIPSLRFGNQSSPARSINVIANAAPGKQTEHDDVFIEVSVDNDQPYVQAQVIFKVKLFRAIATSNATLSEPVLNGGQAIVDKLGDDNSYESQRGGRRYVVIERRYVIFPQNSGKMTIEPVVFQGQTGAGGFFRFDPFGPAGKTIIKRSPAIQLDVKPIPADYPGGTWLPASKLSLQEQWSVSPEKLKQGEATTRTLILVAEGLAASHLPAVEDVLPDEFKTYPDQPELEERDGNTGFVGTRREKMAVIPTTAGSFTLPSLGIYWWNTLEDRLETAELPEREIRVATAANIPAQQAPVATPQSRSEPGPADALMQSPQNTEPGLWHWVSLFFFILWMVTLFAWYRARSRPPIQHKKQESQASLAPLNKKVLKSADRDDAMATRDALLDWANSRWPQQHFVNIGQLKSCVDEALSQEIDALNAYLYGRNNQQAWKGDRLAKLFQSQTFSENKNKEDAGKLEPLYKS